MIIQTDKQYQAIKHAADISNSILHQLTEAVKIGVTPKQIDDLAWDLCKKAGTQPDFAQVRHRNGQPYGYATCICVNDAAVHGVPSSEPFQANDLVTLDFGLIKDGYFTDHCVTIGLSPLEGKNKKLLDIGRRAVLEGVKQAVVGNHTGDIGHAMETTARGYHFDTIKQYIGHGIGRSLHEEPEVPATGRRGSGTKLVEGQVICVEAQVVAGRPDVYVDDADGWTVRTVDGKNSVMFEYMVVVRKGQPEVLTPSQDWELIK